MREIFRKLLGAGNSRVYPIWTKMQWHFEVLAVWICTGVWDLFIWGGTAFFGPFCPNHEFIPESSRLLLPAPPKLFAVLFQYRGRHTWDPTWHVNTPGKNNWQAPPPPPLKKLAIFFFFGGGGTVPPCPLPSHTPMWICIVSFTPNLIT